MLLKNILSINSVLSSNSTLIITSLAAKIARNALVSALEEFLLYIVNEIAEYASLLQGRTSESGA